MNWKAMLLSIGSVMNLWPAVELTPQEDHWVVVAAELRRAMSLFSLDLFLAFVLSGLLLHTFDVMSSEISTTPSTVSFITLCYPSFVTVECSVRTLSQLRSG